MLKSPLTLRINDGTTDQHVTAAASGLKFKKTAPGGFASAQVRLSLPVDAFSRLGPSDRMWIYDARTGNTVWEGFTDAPGTTTDAEGQGFDVIASGTQTLASDETRILIYRDADLSDWEQYRAQGAAASANASSSDDPNGEVQGQGLITQFSPGQPIGTNALAQIGYEPLKTSGMTVGAIKLSGKAGKTDTGYRAEIAWSSAAAGSGGASTVLHGSQIITSDVTDTRYVSDSPGAADIPAGRTAIALRLRRAGGATNIADDLTWIFWHDVAVMGRMLARGAANPYTLPGRRTGDYVLASWVVEDLLLRLLPLCDAASAQIDTTSWPIDQLAYREGTKVASVLDDLTLWEPDYLWEILEDRGRGFRFNYRAWPTTARYEISTKDGYKVSGSDADLCNRIAVKWTDKNGVKQVTTVSRVVPDLGSRIRDADSIELPEGRGSEASAQRIGAQVLAEKATPPTAATATIVRPVLDRLRGAMVLPHEIEPGYLVRVRETGEDLRMTEMEYDDDAQAATLTLGTPALTIEQRVARLAKA